MRGKNAKGDRGNIIIVKKEEIIEAASHGGAWKIAYADFVTAMMAFFLLMWLINSTTEDQRRGIADYFTPSNAWSHASSGSGKPFGGHTPFDQGDMVSDRGAESVRPVAAPQPMDSEETDPDHPPPVLTQTDPPDDPQPGAAAADAAAPGAPTAATGTAAPATAAPGAAAMAQEKFLANAASAPVPDPHTLDDAVLHREMERRERAAFTQAADQIRDAVRADPDLAKLAGQLAIDVTPEGLRIQLLDEDRQSMFPTGSAVLNDRAKLLLQKIAPVLGKLPEGISVSGHTDAAPYKGDGKSNWELSSERANATRRLLVDAGLQDGRFRSVTGNADRDLLIPADPLAAANRRIAIVVLRNFPAPRS
jgi:chemotaxis protein MotB